MKRVILATIAASLLTTAAHAEPICYGQSYDLAQHPELTVARLEVCLTPSHGPYARDYALTVQVRDREQPLHMSGFCSGDRRYLQCADGSIDLIPNGTSGATMVIHGFARVSDAYLSGGPFELERTQQ
jgi:hypothetical protein